MSLSQPQQSPCYDQDASGQTVAAFDFDGTMTRGDTLLPFLRSVAGDVRFAGGMMQLSPVLLRFAFGRLRNDIAKEAFLTHFLSGMSVKELRARGANFATRKLPAMVRETALRKLDWHKSRGDRCVLISASLDCYLDTWATRTGFDDVLCSSLETDDLGLATGRLLGRNCFGPEKVNRLRALLGESWERTELYAYGDSRGDRELLAAAKHPFFKAL